MTRKGDLENLRHTEGWEGGHSEWPHRACRTGSQLSTDVPSEYVQGSPTAKFFFTLFNIVMKNLFSIAKPSLSTLTFWYLLPSCANDSEQQRLISSPTILAIQANLSESQGCHHGEMLFLSFGFWGKSKSIQWNNAALSLLSSNQALIALFF